MASMIRALCALVLLTLVVGACAAPREEGGRTNGHPYYGAGGGE